MSRKHGFEPQTGADQRRQTQVTEAVSETPRPPSPDPRPPSSSHRPPATDHRQLLLFGLVALAAFLTYLPTLKYGFVWDDKALIVENRYLAEASAPAVFAHNYWYNPDLPATISDKGYYRPLTTLTFLVNRRLSGLNPAGHHLTNVLLHAAVVLLACLVLFQLLGSVTPAVLGGLVIGVNPALNSSVTWISGRNYLLAMLFLLLSFYALLRGGNTRNQGTEESRNQERSPEPQNPRTPEPHSFFWRVLLAGSFLLALLAHEAGIVFALIAAGWILGKPGGCPRVSWVSWLGAVILPVIVYLGLRLGVARVPFVPGALSDVVSQPLVGLNAFGQEMLAWFVPFVQHVMYAPVTGFSGYALFGVVVLAGLALTAFYRRSTPRVLGAVWAIGFLLPFAQLVPWGPSGRMLYLSGFGVVLVVMGWSGALLCGQAKRVKAIAVGLAAVYCVALGAWTVKRNAIWRDEDTLYRATVLEAPESQCAHLYRADSLQAAGETARAVAEYRAALELDPDLVGAHHRLGNILFEQFDFAGAIEEYREVVRLNSSALAHHLLAQAWTKAGRLDSAAAELREVVRRQPDMAAAHTELALNLVQRERLDSALTEFRQAVRLDSMSAETHNNLALAFRQFGMPDSAIREYEKSLTLDPKSYVTLGNLGSARLAMGDRPGAAAAFRQALALKPDFAPARDGLAQALRK